MMGLWIFVRSFSTFYILSLRSFDAPCKDLNYSTQDFELQRTQRISCSHVKKLGSLNADSASLGDGGL
jgi:hypothetical protein